MNRALRFALLGLAVVVVAGCGGNEEPQRLSEAEFRKRAAAICQHWQRETRRVEISVATLHDDLAPLIAAGERREARLRTLAPPEHLEDTWDSYLDFMNEAMERLRDGQAESGDADRMGRQGVFDKLLSEIGQLQGQADPLREQLGIGFECDL